MHILPHSTYSQNNLNSKLATQLEKSVHPQQVNVSLYTNMLVRSTRVSFSIAWLTGHQEENNSLVITRTVSIQSSEMENTPKRNLSVINLHLQHQHFLINTSLAKLSFDNNVGLKLFVLQHDKVNQFVVASYILLFICYNQSGLRWQQMLPDVFQGEEGSFWETGLASIMTGC